MFRADQQGFEILHRQFFKYYWDCLTVLDVFTQLAASMFSRHDKAFDIRRTIAEAMTSAAGCMLRWVCLVKCPGGVAQITVGCKQMPRKSCVDVLSQSKIDLSVDVSTFSSQSLAAVTWVFSVYNMAYPLAMAVQPSTIILALNGSKAATHVFQVLVVQLHLSLFHVSAT